MFVSKCACVEVFVVSTCACVEVCVVSTCVCVRRRHELHNTKYIFRGDMIVVRAS